MADGPASPERHGGRFGGVRMALERRPEPLRHTAADDLGDQLHRRKRADELGTGQPLGDAGQRLAARFTSIGLSARANA